MISLMFWFWYMGCETLEKKESFSIFSRCQDHGFLGCQSRSPAAQWKVGPDVQREAPSRVSQSFGSSTSFRARDVEGEICRRIFHGKKPWFNGFLEIFSHETHIKPTQGWMHIQALVTKPPQPPYPCCPVVNFVRILQLHMLGMAPTIYPNLVPIACAPHLLRSGL